MPQTIKPATPLPWNVIGNGYTIWAENEIIFSANSPRSRGTNASKDAAYIVHACNSLPGLVEALQHIASGGESWKDCANVARVALHNAGIER